jgi:hypothetical protein
MPTVGARPAPVLQRFIGATARSDRDDFRDRALIMRSRPIVARLMINQTAQASLIGLVILGITWLRLRWTLLRVTPGAIFFAKTSIARCKSRQ